MFRTRKRRAISVCAAVIVVLSLGTACAETTEPAAPAQPHYRSIALALDAMLEALRAGDVPALVEIMGPESTGVLSSGDEVADEAARTQFLDAAEARFCIDRPEPDLAVIQIGEDSWPFPIPLVRDDAGWRYDSEAGSEEILDRRIGRNELNTMAVMRAYVEAQYEYAREARGDGKRGTYAQKLVSGEGQRDGLYWPAAEGEPDSPMGALVAQASAQGYKAHTDGTPTPYHGYYYRILTAQGEHAPGGAQDYIRDDHMTGGFALVAYPAEYDNSGIMTLVVNQRGIIYQKDLGEDTGSVARALTSFDPDDSWEAVAEY